MVRGVGTGGSGVGLQSILAGSRKIVQSLKEIVNCPKPKIYAVLKECNMDPNEAVNRFLSQDPFHETKSKRDKKKEEADKVLMEIWLRIHLNLGPGELVAPQTMAGVVRIDILGVAAPNVVLLILRLARQTCIQEGKWINCLFMFFVFITWNCWKQHQ